MTTGFIIGKVCKYKRLIGERTCYWIFVFGLIAGFYQPIHAQNLVTEVVPIHDTTIHRFTDINQLYFLQLKEQRTLKRLVKKLSQCSSQANANKLIYQIAKLKSDQAMVVLGLDYYFKQKQPVEGSNVARVLQFLNNSNPYILIDQLYFNNAISDDLLASQYRKTIQDTLGWRYGYGAFNYLSPTDSLYLVKMKRLSEYSLDVSVEEIIEKYLADQGSGFKYDAEAIAQEVRQLPGVVDVQWDRCLFKHDGLPNWDHLGVMKVEGDDTLERVYAIQYSKFNVIRMGKHIHIPIRQQTDLLWYKGAGYGLRFIEKTRRQCEMNERQRSGGTPMQ